MDNSAHPFKVFVVEDNEWYNKLLVHSISLNPDYEVASFFSGKDFLDHLKEKPDVVTLDFLLPDMDGAAILKKIKDFNEEIEVIIISEQDDIETAIDLLKSGAYDYIVKTKDIRNRLLNTINNISKNHSLKAQIKTLKKEVQKKYDFQTSIVGSSEPIKKIFNLIEKAVNNNISVSITGETGTGKELVAKAIHYNSKRANKPLVVVNIAAIPNDLIESELFGHEKGSFTGAVNRRIGKFEEAHEGTLFLDEIGEMDINFQVKLLRALQEKEVVRVGSNNIIKTDCRIIVATNKNLQDEVKKGKFREDLYYRLFGLPIELPPLRERDKDILILAKYFIEAFCKENDLSLKTLTTEAQKKLYGYSFPGNVRELKSIMELAIVMSNSNEIGQDDITFGSIESVDTIINGDLTLKDYEHRILKTYMSKYNDNINLVSQKLDISASTIYRMLKETKTEN